MPHVCSRTAPIIPAASRSLVQAGPGEFTTTNGEALKHWPTQKQAPFRPKEGSRDLAPFEGQSAYTSDFVPKAGDRSKAVMPVSTLKQNGGPVESTTTMRGAFLGTAGERAEARRPVVQRAIPATFEGMTTMKQDFAGHAGERPAAVRPRNDHRAQGPFDGRTQYVDSYPAHAIAPRAQAPRDPYCPNGAPFEGTTTMQTDFVPQGHGKRDAIRPVERRRDSAPGEYTTNYNDTMKQWTVAREAPRVLKGTLRPQGEFQGTTEMRDMFTPKANTRSAPIVPLAVLAPSGPFHGETSYKNSFHAPPPPCAVLRMPRTLWQECACTDTAHPHSHGQQVA